MRKKGVIGRLKGLRILQRKLQRMFAFAGDAADPLDSEEAERGDADDEADGKADALIGEGEVDGLVGGDGVDAEADDGEKGSEEEGGEAGGKAHKEGLEPAKVAEGDAEEGAFAAGAFYVMRGGHLQ
jgi:hypothetical protein